MTRHSLISLRPKFAEAIYKGIKLYEFRRVRVRMREGDHVFIYETSPVSRLTGEFRVGKVILGSPSQLYSLEPSRNSREEAKRYLLGAQFASAIQIVAAVQWQQSRSLQEVLPGYRPPRSYVFIKEPIDGILRGSSQS